MTKDNNLTEIESCVSMVEADAPEMKMELVAAINDFKFGGWDHIVQGVLELLLVGLQVPQVLHVCKNIQDDVSAIEAWAKNFSDLKNLSATLTKHYLFHKKQVDADVTILKADAAEQKWFATGEEAAVIATLLLPIQAPALF